MEQARIAFGGAGVDASLDDVVRGRGERHAVPALQTLVEAVLAEQVPALIDLGRRLLTVEDDRRACSCSCSTARAKAGRRRQGGVSAVAARCQDGT
ncbi:hypothetical protein ACFYOT_36130 [Saccharothrix saharensis]|uniref:hypothetical protein n=1 Tax=Saccharothrix saharensis TaxID=571190 RepID=UPI0036B859EF